MLGESATRALVAATRALDLATMPADAREVARHCIVDFLGCAVAGSREDLVGILVEHVVRGEASTQSTLIGRHERATRLTAALVNGAAGHALDFDDTHTTMTGHPSVPVLPALLALGESERASGRRLLDATVRGIEFECRIGALLGVQHYGRGFHATGTIGTFGAAAGCAQMLGLGEDAWLHAVGLAGTQAAGLKASFGTMAKPLHAGRAASAGLLAALLARGGFTGHTAILEAPQGFAATQAGQEVAAGVLDEYRDRFLIRNTLFKVHAACYLTHAAIEAVAALRKRHALVPDEVERIEVSVAPPVLDVCNIAEPKTGLEGKFSLRATTALALLGEDTADPSTFSDAKMADPRLVALRDRVRVTGVDGFLATQSRVVLTSGGRRLEAAADTGVPATDLGAQRERLLRKFNMLATPVLGTTGAHRLAHAALGLDDADSVGELLRLVRTT